MSFNDFHRVFFFFLFFLKSYLGPFDADGADASDAAVSVVDELLAEQRELARVLAELGAHLLVAVVDLI